MALDASSAGFAAQQGCGSAAWKPHEPDDFPVASACRALPFKKLNELPISRGQRSEKYWFGKDLGGKVEIKQLPIKPPVLLQGTSEWRSAARAQRGFICHYEQLT